ncbi:hypothetical protein TNCV_4954951 [Trichonephila clavipes]|nr:hypothetical protein TNCV_4954951 [Trichonephila clavipes]
MHLICSLPSPAPLRSMTSIREPKPVERERERVTLGYDMAQAIKRTWTHPNRRSLLPHPVLKFCEELTAMKNYIRRLRIICNEKGKTVSLLRSDHGHDESDAQFTTRLE